MTIYHIPARFMRKDYKDAREQDVREDSYALPQPGISDPIYLQALKGTLPPGTCSACGEPTELHRDVTGCLHIGCAAVPARKALNAYVNRPLRDLTVWGDAHPGVSAAIRDTLRVGCGPLVAQFFEELGWDERINLSRRLAEIAAVALRKEDADGR